MALNKHQRILVERLIAMGRLAPAVLPAYIDDPDEVTMEELESVLQSEHQITDRSLMFARSFNRGMQPYPAEKHRPEPDAFSLVSHDDCVAMNCLPVAWTDEFLSLAVGPNFNPADLSKIQEAAKRQIVLMMSSAKDVADKLKERSDPSGGSAMAATLKELKDGLNIGGLEEEVTKENAEESGPVIDLVNTIIEEAYHSGASDIHIDPHEKELVVRFRIDGNLSIKHRLPGKAAGAVIARIKIMCDLNIAEKRMPQDGRIVFKKYTRKNLDVDLRVSTGPLNYGEGVVMRILDKQKSTLPLPLLGFTDENLARYRECVRQPYGMILHCGPTGSGKSMTLYSALNEINTEDVCIRTAEDPIEYTLPGLTSSRLFAVETAVSRDSC